MICDHLDWLNWLWAPFVGLAIVFWIKRGPGPRAPLLYLLGAGLLTALFALSAAAADIAPLLYVLLSKIPMLGAVCMIGAPVLVGIAFGMARGARLFVVAVAFVLLTALPVWSVMAGLALGCPQYMSD